MRKEGEAPLLVHGPAYHHALEHHAVGYLWLDILPRFARRKDLSFDVLVLGET